MTELNFAFCFIEANFEIGLDVIPGRSIIKEICFVLSADQLKAVS